MNIGRRPIAAFGNPMATCRCCNGPPPARAHASVFTSTIPTGKREWAYDRDSSIGRLDKGLDEAKVKDWTVVSMKDDWKSIFPFEKNLNSCFGLKRSEDSLKVSPVTCI